MISIGLTGNVASGKTTVAERWREAGVRVIDADRLGHDRRYTIDSTLVRKQTSWRPQVEFIAGLQATVRWYAENPDWVATVSN